MSGESISGLILFIAAMLVAAGVAGTLVVSVTDVTASVDTHSDDLSDRIDTDVSIISDPGSSAIYNDSPGDERVIILVKNTGDRTLPTDGTELDVSLNGEYIVLDADDVTPVESDGDDNTTPWRPGEVVEIELSVDDPAQIESSENRVHLHVHGNTEEFEFYVP